jgi:hypothetical protein
VIKIGDRTTYTLNQLKDNQCLEVQDKLLYGSSNGGSWVCFDSVDYYMGKRQLDHWFLIAYDRPGIWLGHRSETWGSE